MKKAILSLGTNLNDRLNNLKTAIKFLKKVSDTEFLKVSKIYETEPFGVPDKQDNYYNCCVLLKTKLNPYILLEDCLKIELKMGRKRPYKNAPRIIDIDMIYYEGKTCNDQNLILPHPRAKDRAFVLVPILDVLSFDDELRKRAKFYLEKLEVTEIKEVGSFEEH